MFKEDNDSSLVFMDILVVLANFIERSIEEDINNGVYAPANDTTLQDLKLFQSFLHRIFKNQPERL